MLRDPGLLVIPRNWSQKGVRFSNADAFLVSIPKSGRTWLRFALRHYLCAEGGIPFSIDPCEDEPEQLPRLVCSHDLWEHLTAPGLSDRIRGKYLIPPAVRRRTRIVLAVRDLRDVMVSLHLQLTRRGFRSGARYHGSLSQMIRDRRFGARRAAEILNHWLGEWRDTGRCLVWSYEGARKDPTSSIRDVLAFLGVEKVDEALLAQSIEFSSFDNMKAMEKDNRFDRKLLKPGDPSDPESFKVRRGRIGGFVDYLSEDDARFVQACAARIHL